MFEHKKDDIVMTVRFRADVWRFLECRMHNLDDTAKKRVGRQFMHLPTKGIHEVLDQELRRLIQHELQAVS